MAISTWSGPVPFCVFRTGASRSDLSQTAALAQISKQNDLWRDYRDNLRNAAATRLAQSGNDGAGNAAAGSDAATAEEEATPALSEDAQAILDRAREEVRNRRDLNILADNNESTSGAASATADQSQAEDDGRLGEINQKLQLAREELASTRLQSEDLSDQASDLQSTSENLDALLNLRQTEVAELETQLTQAREAQQAEEARLAEEEAAAEKAAEQERIAAEEAAEQAAEEERVAAEQAAEEAAEQERVATEEAAEQERAATRGSGSRGSRRRTGRQRTGRAGTGDDR